MDRYEILETDLVQDGKRLRLILDSRTNKVVTLNGTWLAMLTKAESRRWVEWLNSMETQRT